MSTEFLPLWLAARDEPEEFPTKTVREEGLFYSFGLFTDWKKQARPFADKPEAAMRIFRGLEDAEWLVVTHMTTAVAGHNMNNWVNYELAISGFPCAYILAGVKPTPRLLSWVPGGNNEAFLAETKGEENLLFTGTALFGPQRARLFMVMVRIRNYAWKFCLSLPSKIGQGENEAVVLMNDCTRAAHVLGSLSLFPPPAQQQHKSVRKK